MNCLRMLTLFVLIGLGASAAADELLMARITQPFPEAMNSLQETIRARGYVVSRVQRVDVGLTASGFQTAEYRIVFFGKQAEIRELAEMVGQIIEPLFPVSWNALVETEEDAA